MSENNVDEASDGGLPPRTGSPSSLTPRTDAIMQFIALANHPETDGEHFRAFMESARNGVESLESERNALLNNQNEFYRKYKEAHRELRLLAMLAAKTPQFFNPLVAMEAEGIRDRILSENA